MTTGPASRSAESREGRDRRVGSRRFGLVALGVTCLVGCANPEGRGQGSSSGAQPDLTVAPPSPAEGDAATTAGGDAPPDATRREDAAVVDSAGAVGGEPRLLRRANAVSGWAAKHRAELEACVGGVSLTAATLVLEIAEDGTVNTAHLQGVEVSVTSAEACIRDVTTRLRFVAAEVGEGASTLEVPFDGR